MYEFHPYFTNDGSVGLFNTDFNDIYHSADGALTEAYEKFINPVNMQKLLNKESVKILDICYGIGYNSKSFLNTVLDLSANKNLKNKKSCKKKLFENFFSEKKFFKKLISEKFSKINSPYKYNIDTIHTNNIFSKILSSIQEKYNNNTIYNNTIYTDNILENKSKEIYIKAVDNDKILSYLSPFIKTGVQNITNQKFNFEYKQIEKYLNNNSNIEHKKVDNIINFLILENIMKNCPEILENDELFEVINNRDFKEYFDKKLVGIFKSYKKSICHRSHLKAKLGNLHNIYYRNISNGYKRALKHYLKQDIIFELKNEDARKTLLEDNNRYNLIFLDAFTPSKCPCLWSLEFFKELCNHLEDDGELLTYSTSASIRNAMKEAGFNIGYIYNERKNKYTGTIATKNKSLIKYPLTEYDLGLLNTTAGIFYRDENLTGQNEAIIEARNFEVKNSTKTSSSHYKKMHGEDKCSTI